MPISKKPRTVPPLEEFVELLHNADGGPAVNEIAALAGIKYIGKAKLTPNGVQLVELMDAYPRLAALQLLEVMVRTDRVFAELYGAFLAEKSFDEAQEGIAELVEVLELAEHNGDLERYREWYEKLRTVYDHNSWKAAGLGRDEGGEEGEEDEGVVGSGEEE